MREIVIEKNEAGQRLDKFLAKYMNEASKSFFYKMMRKKNITLNGKKQMMESLLNSIPLMTIKKNIIATYVIRGYFYCSCLHYSQLQSNL